MDIKIEHRNVEDLSVKEVIVGFYMVKVCELKTSSNGSQYINMNLGDATGEINTKIWDANDALAAKLAIGTIVKVNGTVSEYQGTLQIKVDKIRPATELDNVNPAEFVPVAPYPPEEMFDMLFTTASSFKNSSLKAITLRILSDNKKELVYWPAAKKNHHAIRSGLLYHTSTMLKTAMKVTEVYTFLDKEMLFAGVILHDMAKINEMNSNNLGIVSDYTIEGNLIGHLVKGAMNIEIIGKELGCDEEVVMLLAHMILSHHFQPEYGSPKMPMTPEAEMLHLLDLMDARMYDMKHITESLNPGEISEKVWPLDGRQIYRARFGE